MGPEILEESFEGNIEDEMNIKVSSEFSKQVSQKGKQTENSKMEKGNETFLQVLEKEKLENQSDMLTLNELQELETEVFQNESNHKDKQVEFLKLDLTEAGKKENQLLNEKMQANPSFLAPNIENTLNTKINISQTSYTPDLVPNQNEKVQRVQISYSSDGEEQINDLMPDQETVKTHDDQLQIMPKSKEQKQEQQPMEVTQLENTVAPPIPILPTQVPSQLLVQRSPKNTSIEGSLLEILNTPGTTGTSGLQSSLAKKDSQLTVMGYVYQSPITLPNVAKTTWDDPGEEIIKTEIKAEEQQQQPMRLTQLENTILLPMATLSNQVTPQSGMQNSPKNTSNVGEGPSATPEIVLKQGEKVQRAQISYSNDGQEQISDLMPDQQAWTFVVESSLTTPGKVIDRIDNISDQTYDDHLVGRKIRGNYKTGCHNGRVEYLNIKLKEYFVLFDDGSSDYIKKDDIDVTEKLQRVQISYSNVGKDQIHDLLLSGQNAVQIPDGQLQIFSQSLKESSKENIEINMDILEKETEKNNGASIEKSEQTHQNTEEESNSEDSKIECSDQFSNVNIDIGKNIKDVDVKTEKSLKVPLLKIENNIKDSSEFHEQLSQEEKKSENSKMEKLEESSTENIGLLVRYQVSVSENVKKRGRKRSSLKGQVSNQKGMRDHAHQGLANAAKAKG